MKRALLVMFAALAVAACLGAANGAAAGDSVKVVSITAAEPVVRGVENEFTVEVEYKLESADEGEINLGFNLDRPKGFKMVESHVVQRGAGTATLKARVIPVDWRERGRFQMLVNLSKYPHAGRWSPLASERREIEVGQ